LDGFDFQYVVALDKHSGKTVWKTDRSVEWGNTDGDFKKAYSTPLLIEVDSRRELVSSGSKAAMAYDPATGRELWKVRYEGFSSTARPLFGHGLVFINTGFSKADLYAVRPGGNGDVTDSHVAWKVTRGIGSKPSPVLVDDLLLMVHDNGVALCLEAKTGKEVWSKRLGGAFSASPIVADGRVYFFSQQGAASVVKPGRKFELLATNKLADGFMASPAAADKALYLRTEKALYRIEE
jgi:outer membrane protein assembly factor BamB